MGSFTPDVGITGFGVSSDKRLYMPALGEIDFSIAGNTEYWGTRLNEDLAIIASELKDLSSIKLERISDEVRDALSFGIKGKSADYSHITADTAGIELVIGDMWVCEAVYVGGGTFPRGIYKYNASHVWEFFVSLDPVNISFLDLVDTPSSFTGHDGESLVVDEANSRLVFQRNATKAELDLLEGDLQTTVDGISDVVSDNFSGTSANSNINLKGALNAESMGRVAQDVILQSQVNALKIVDQNLTSSINGIDVRVQDLENFGVAPPRHPLRTVVDDLVKSNVIIGKKPSDYGYNLGERVAVNDQGTAINGDIYIAALGDVWEVDTPFFFGIGVYNNTDNILYFYDMNDRNGQYRNCLFYAGNNLYAPRKDYPMSWYIVNFITDAAEVRQAPSIGGYGTNNAVYAVRDNAEVENGEVYRVDAINDVWIKIDGRTHGLGIYNRTDNFRYYFNGAGTGGDWISNNISGVLTWKGLWDATSGALPTPAVTGDMYKVSVTGTVGGITYNAGDSIYYNGATFDKLANSDISFPADVFLAPEVAALQGFVNSATEQLSELGTDGDAGFKTIALNNALFFDANVAPFGNSSIYSKHNGGSISQNDFISFRNDPVLSGISMRNVNRQTFIEATMISLGQNNVSNNVITLRTTLPIIPACTSEIRVEALNGDIYFKDKFFTDFPLTGFTDSAWDAAWTSSLSGNPNSILNALNKLAVGIDSFSALVSDPVFDSVSISTDAQIQMTNNGGTPGFVINPLFNAGGDYLTNSHMLFKSDSDKAGAEFVAKNQALFTAGTLEMYSHYTGPFAGKNTMELTCFGANSVMFVKSHGALQLGDANMDIQLTSAGNTSWDAWFGANGGNPVSIVDAINRLASLK